jgi:hypothetical protein
VSYSHRPSCVFAVLLVLAALLLPACTEVETETATGYEPSSLDEGMRVTFTEEAAERIGLETARVERHGKRRAVPYAALLYDPEGGTYVYTSPRRLRFLRAPVEVVGIDGNVVVLSEGPPAGTEVVTAGAAEVYGTELEVASH